MNYKTFFYFCCEHLKTMNMKTIDIEVCKLLRNDKIKFNWNKNPIKFEDFRNMIKIPLVSNTECLGYFNGWRSYENKEHGLFVGCGIVNGYGLLLNDIQYGHRLDNKFNNYVNPFFLGDLLNEYGMSFFKEYYKDDIIKLIEEKQKRIDYLKNSIKTETELLNNIKQTLL